MQKRSIDKVVNALLGQIEKFPERLFLTSSIELEKTWNEYGLAEFYPTICTKKESKKMNPKILRLFQKRLDKVQQIIDNYTEMGYYNEVDSLERVIVKEEKRASINNSKTEDSDDNLSADMDAI